MTLPDFIPFDPNQLLLGYQRRWIADESQLKIAEKSRRTQGKIALFSKI